LIQLLSINEASISILASAGIPEKWAIKATATTVTLSGNKLFSKNPTPTNCLTPKDINYICRIITKHTNLSLLRHFVLEFPGMLELPLQTHLNRILLILNYLFSLSNPKITLTKILRQNPTLLLLTDNTWLTILKNLERLEVPTEKWSQIVLLGRTRSVDDFVKYITFMEHMKFTGIKVTAISNGIVQILHIVNKINTVYNKHSIQETKTIESLLSCLTLRFQVLGFSENGILELVSKFPDSGRFKIFNFIKFTKYLRLLKIKEKNIIEMFINYPRLVLCYKPTSIKIKLWYILKVKRLPFSMIMENPSILSYSLNRIVSRVEFVKCRTPYICKQHELSSWIQPNNKVFFEKRVCSSFV
jgi:hypothetical protein